MDSLTYNITETLKLLVIIASEPEKQIEAMGIGNTEEEIAIDFESHFKWNEAAFIENGLISEAQALKLSEIDSFFEIRSGDEFKNYQDFWVGIDSHKDWLVLRKMAKRCLAILDKANLGIIVETKNTVSKTSGKNIVSQNIMINLISNDT